MIQLIQHVRYCIVMQHVQSVNSMYNMETMPKMAIIIAIILIAIIIKVFNYFHKSALINLKPIKPFKKLSKANDEGSSHLWFIFLHVLGITISNIKSSLLYIFFRCLSAWKISEWCMYNPSWNNFDQKILKPRWLEVLW